MSHSASQPGLKFSIRQLLRRRPAALAMLGLPGLAFAGPTGEDVIRGAADVTRPDANGTVIDQHTQRAVINWQTFNVDADEYVLFNQLDSSSVVLNRVVGGDASHILGHMQANGQVFLLNAQGVFFGAGATIDVQGFLGSTLDMDPDAFMAGDYVLTRHADSPSSAQVINDGQITAGSGGYVVLAGDYTENTGIIAANAGTVALVSGNALTLDIEGDGLVSFAVNEATLSEAAGVRNAGSLIADGGMVVMTAQVASDLVATAVNNEGLVRARSVEERDGEIWLVGHGGDVNNHGVLDADGENAGGGQIMVWSDRNILLADGATQTANGDAGHDGGDMRFIAKQRLDYRAGNLISATGGPGGFGGRVEVSGHGGLTVAGTPVLGPGGELYIDPDIIAITRFSDAPAYTSSGTAYAWESGLTPSWYDAATEDVTSLGRGWIEGQLIDGVDVTLVASERIVFDSIVNGVSLATSGTGDLGLYIGSIESAGGATQFGGGNGGVFTGGSVVIKETADPDARGINVGGLNINIGGNFTASIVGASESAVIAVGEVNANNIVVNAGGPNVGQVAFGDFLSSHNATSNITITGNSITTGYIGTANNVTINGNITGSNFQVGSSAAVTNVRNLTVNGNIDVANGVWLNVGSGSISVNGTVTAGSYVSFLAAGSSSGPGNINAGFISAGGGIKVEAHGPQGAGSGGNITLTSGASAGESITLIASGGISGGGNIQTGGLTVNNTTGSARITLNASGGITVAGNVSAAGYGGVTGDGSLDDAANVEMIASDGGLNITGGININGRPGAYDTPTAGSGVHGHARFYAYAGNDGNINIGGPIQITGTGIVEAGLEGAEVRTGNITLLANPEHYEVSPSFGELTHQSAVAAGGAELYIRSIDASNSGLIDVGDISVTGPNAYVELKDARTTNTGAITVSATGNEMSYTASSAGVTGTETFKGGHAGLNILGAQNANNTSINVGGAINVAAPGFASVNLAADNVSTRSINASATAGRFTREGDYFLTSSSRGGESPFGHTGFGAPAIDLGTLEGGAATIQIYGNPFFALCDGTCDFAPPSAANVSINGSLSASAPGNASIIVFGDNIGVSGGINAAATRGVTQGTYYQVSDLGEEIVGTVNANNGDALVQLEGLSSAGHSVSVGGPVSVTGPMASLEVRGHNVGFGNAITVSAAGGAIDVTETSYTNGVPTGGHRIATSNLITPVGIKGSGAVTVNGDITISGPVAAGMLLQGNTVSTRNISVAATAGSVKIKDPEFRDGAEYTINAGNAILGIEAATGRANVQGNVTVNGAVAAHVGGDAAISGTLSVTGGSGLFGAVPDYVNLLDGLREDIVDLDHIQVPAVDFRAGNVNLNVTAGDLILGTAQIATTGAMTLSASRNVDISGRTQAAGSFAINGAGVNLSNAILNATGAIDVIATNTLNATNTRINGTNVSLSAATLGLENAVLANTGATELKGTAAINARGVRLGGTIATLTGGSVDLRDALADVGTLNASGSTVNVSGATFTAADQLNVVANGALNAASATLNGKEVRLEAGTNLSVSNISLDADAAALIAGGNITNSAPPGTISAGALAILAGGDVDLGNTTLLVGTGRIASVPGDSDLLRLLAGEGIGVPEGGPNLVVRGRNVRLGGGSLAGDYVYLETNNLSVNGNFTASNPDLLLQVAPLSTSATFSLEQSSPGGGDVAYTYTGMLDRFDAATIALGTTGHTGAVGIGGSGATVNIGDTNLFVLTRGEVKGLSNVLSTGVVKDLRMLLGSFEVPQTDEIDANHDLAQTLNSTYRVESSRSVEEEEEGDEEGEDTDSETDVEEEEDNLIRQETADEEMMCR